MPNWRVAGGGRCKKRLGRQRRRRAARARMRRKRHRSRGSCWHRKSASAKVRGLSQAKRRALALADNRIAESAGWDRELLAIELPALAEILVVEGLDVSITGFSPVEIDQLMVDFEEDASDP